MTTTFCTTCGSPLDTPFCSECGAPRPTLSQDIDATLVRATPPAIAPEPTMALPPLYAPPPAVGTSQKPDRTKMWWATGAAAALVIGAVSVALAAGGSSSHSAAAAGPTSLVTPSAAPSSTATLLVPTSSILEPGTRSALVPSWANERIGRLVRAEKVLGATGTAVFASPGRNICAVLGSEVSCVATPLWHKDDPGALPPIDPNCSAAPEGRWSVFTIGSTGSASAVGCSTTPTALTLGSGTAPYNRVIGMGATGVLCYIDARRGTPTSQTGVACWNPATNHGFMITHQGMSLW